VLHLHSPYLSVPTYYYTLPNTIGKWMINGGKRIGYSHRTDTDYCIGKRMIRIQKSNQKRKGSYYNGLAQGRRKADNT